MNSRCVLQYVYGTKYEEQLLLTSDITLSQCMKFGYDYRLCTHTPKRHPCWERVQMLIDAFEAGYMQAFWLDTDSLWVGDEPLHNAIVNDAIFSLTRHHACKYQPTDHFNIGVMYVNNSPHTLEFLHEWNETSDDGSPWYEQYALNKLIYTNQTVTKRSYSTLRQISHRWNALPHIPPYWEENPVVISWHGHPYQTQAMEAYLNDRNR